MLTIKKRFPSQKLYLYGGTAFVAGFAGIMFLLVHTNTHLRNFMAVAPVNMEISSGEQSEKSQAPATSTSEEAILNQDQVFVNPEPNSSQTRTQQPAMPAAQEPARAQPTTPTEPAHTEPEPTPEEPTNPIEEIIEEIITKP